MMNPEQLYPIEKHLDGFARDLAVFDGLAATSVKIYRRLVTEFFTWLEGNSNLRPVDQLTRQDVESYLEWCYYPIKGVRRGNGNQTRLTKLIALKRYARFLRRQGIVPLDRDFTDDIPKPKIRKRFIPMFTQEEHRAMFLAIDPAKEKGLRDIVIFILAGFCGLRAGEISQLRIEHIQDYVKAMDISVPDDITKQGGRGSSGRTVDLWAVPARDVRRYLTARLTQGARPEDPLLVTYRHKRPGTRRLADSDIDFVVKLYAARAGLRRTGISSHWFRATHAENCLHVKGFHNPRAIASRLGHASIATTDRYLSNQHRITKIHESFASFYSWYGPGLWEKKSTDGGADAGK